MSEITREYLNSIGFRIDDVKNYNVKDAFAWDRTHEGFFYWAEQVSDGLTSEGMFKLNEMVRVWEADLPKPAFAMAKGWPKPVLVIPAGWKLVPITPDDKMKDAVREAGGPQALAYALASWQTMLANAPQPPEVGA